MAGPLTVPRVEFIDGFADEHLGVAVVECRGCVCRRSHRPGVPEAARARRRLRLAVRRHPGSRTMRAARVSVPKAVFPALRVTGV